MAGQVVVYGELRHNSERGGSSGLEAVGEADGGGGEVWRRCCEDSSAGRGWLVNREEGEVVPLEGQVKAPAEALRCCQA